MSLPTQEPCQLRQAARCLARTRLQTLCQSPPTRHGRCRLHGGAAGTGAPSGERNGMWRHGYYSYHAIEMRRAIRELMRDARETIATF